VPTKSAGDNYSRRKFTPYSITDYKTLSRTHNAKLGGLGANFDHQWEGKIKQQEKAKDFSKMIKEFNSEKVQKNPPRPPQQDKGAKTEKNAREKALEFAKQIPKPKRKPAKEEEKEEKEMNGVKSRLDMEINEIEGDLDALERQHQFFQEKINKLKT
jgi:hypothetical protein